MKVKELVEILSAHDQEAFIVLQKDGVKNGHPPFEYSPLYDIYEGFYIEEHEEGTEEKKVCVVFVSTNWEMDLFFFHA